MKITFDVSADKVEDVLQGALDGYSVGSNKSEVRPKDNFDYVGERYSIHEKVSNTGSRFYLEIDGVNNSDKVLFDDIKETNKLGWRQGWILYRDNSSVLSFLDEQINNDFSNALDMLYKHLHYQGDDIDG